MTCRAALSAQGIGFDAGFLSGGQIGSEPLRLFPVYAAGDSIEAAPDTPCPRIGEVKYGRPILDRVPAHDAKSHGSEPAPAERPPRQVPRSPGRGCGGSVTIRGIWQGTSLNDAAKPALVSMDGALRSNLTVGMPLDLMVARAGELRVSPQRRLTCMTSPAPDRASVSIREPLESMESVVIRWRLSDSRELPEPQPSPRQGLGVPEPERPRLPALGVDPPDGQKALPENIMIPDGLSERV